MSHIKRTTLIRFTSAFVWLGQLEARLYSAKSLVTVGKFEHRTQNLLDKFTEDVDILLKEIDACEREKI